ncbi:MAG: hypothetical protein QG671_3408 [Actinomycetota bacterium]|nr:hypothetical protein [Actinomycetota bacterium]
MTLSTRAEDTRHLLYNELAATGTLPSRSALAERLGIAKSELQEDVEELAAARHVVIEGGDVVLAHPFATRSFGFSVMGPDTLWWGGCAWDAFAIPNLVPDSPSVLVATTCPACNAPHACENQLIFCSLTCVSDRLQRTGNPRGYVMTLATLWRLAEHWYDGRLDTPYERRDPPLAADYFRRAGLTGGFWGLSDIPQTR